MFERFCGKESKTWTTRCLNNNGNALMLLGGNTNTAETSAELPTEWAIIYSNSRVKMQILGLGAYEIEHYVVKLPLDLCTKGYIQVATTMEESGVCRIDAEHSPPWMDQVS